MGIDPALIRSDAESLRLLQQLFPRDASGLAELRYALTAAGEATLPFNSEEEAFIAQVFERLAQQIALRPLRSSDAAEPFQLASVLRIEGDDRVAGITYSSFTTLNQNVVLEDSSLRIELELSDDPGLSASEQATIVHEIGHALGLEHPGGDPDDPAYDDRDTVMSYNLGEAEPATWFSDSDLQALREIWGDTQGARSTPDPAFRIDQLISGGVSLPGFDPLAGDVLELNAALLPRPSTRLRTVASSRALRQAQRRADALVYDERSATLYLNDNGRARGWGPEGGMLAVLDAGVLLSASDLLLV